MGRQRVDAELIRMSAVEDPWVGIREESGLGHSRLPTNASGKLGRLALRGDLVEGVIQQ
jgi:hypothetical protein